MKKNYIRPESKLFAINLDEDIAKPSGEEEGQGGTPGQTGFFKYVLYDDGRLIFANHTDYVYIVIDGMIEDALKKALDDIGSGLMQCM